jgi:hypothetical protein
MPEPAEPEPFFVVWSPQGGSPIVRYPSHGSARAAAGRLSLRLPGQDFFVLASCGGRVWTPAPAEPLASGPPAGDHEDRSP